MPEWLSILICCLGGASTATAILSVWLRPLFKLREDVNKNTAHIKKIEQKQENDYKARLRSEKYQKAQIKALLALLNNELGAQNERVIKTVKTELEECLIENI